MILVTCSIEITKSTNAGADLGSSHGIVFWQKELELKDAT